MSHLDFCVGLCFLGVVSAEVILPGEFVTLYTDRYMTDLVKKHGKNPIGEGFNYTYSMTDGVCSFGKSHHGHPSRTSDTCLDGTTLTFMNGRSCVLLDKVGAISFELQVMAKDFRIRVRTRHENGDKSDYVFDARDLKSDYGNSKFVRSLF